MSLNQNNLVEIFESEALANKIVKLDEVREKAEEIRRERLSGLQMLRHHIATNTKWFTAPILIAKLMLNSHVRQSLKEDFYTWANPKPSQRKDRFASGLYFANAFAASGYDSLEKYDEGSYVRRQAEAYIEAFQQSRDYAPENKNGLLKRHI